MQVLQSLQHMAGKKQKEVRLSHLMGVGIPAASKGMVGFVN